MSTLFPPASQQKTLCSYRGDRHRIMIFVFFLAVCICLHAQTTAQVSIVGPTQVRLGGNAQYSATLGGAPTPVAWSVNGFPGGNTTTGLIATSGVYSPSSTIWAGHSVTITAKTVSQPVSSTAITVKVLNPLPVLASGVITQTTPSNSYSLVVQGSGFVPASQLQCAGVGVATLFVSPTRLQGTMSIAPGTTAIKIGVLNPNAAQKVPASMTLPVPTGTAIPTLAISPSNVPFGNTTINTPSSQTVTLASTGTAAVTVNSATLSGATFTISGATFPVTLSPGLAVTLDVQFDPTVSGTATGSLSVQSNSSTNGVATVSLSGTGVPHQVALSWDAQGSSTASISSYNTYRSTAGTSAYQLLHSSAVPQTTYVDTTVQSGGTYGYIVTSVDSTGKESAPSNEVSETIP
jgi:hypothetical protein